MTASSFFDRGTLCDACVFLIHVTSIWIFLCNPGDQLTIFSMLVCLLRDSALCSAISRFFDGLVLGVEIWKFWGSTTFTGRESLWLGSKIPMCCANGPKHFSPLQVHRQRHWRGVASGWGGTSTSVSAGAHRIRASEARPLLPRRQVRHATYWPDGCSVFPSPVSRKSDNFPATKQ